MEPSDTELKAMQLGGIAKRNGWTGSIQHNDNLNETIFRAKRAAERIFMQWANGRLAEKPEYKLLSRVYTLQSQVEVIEKLEGWPDIIKILDINRKRKDPKNPVQLVKYYSRLPFDIEKDDDETIISALVNRQIWWYNSISMKIDTAKVMMPKKKSQVFSLKQVGHRKMFNFTEPQIGMRSVMLDQIVKVQ